MGEGRDLFGVVTGFHERHKAEKVAIGVKYAAKGTASRPTSVISSKLMCPENGRDFKEAS